jgi:AraC-like DNA-binding protein
MVILKRVYTRPWRQCKDCDQSYPVEKFSTWTRCDLCQAVRNRAYAATKRALRPAPRDRRGFPWLPEELARLKEACERGMTISEAADHVGFSRSARGCKRMMFQQCWRGLKNDPFDRHYCPTWPKKRTERLLKAVQKYGPREAARRLGISPNAVAGALHRWRKRCSA